MENLLIKATRYTPEINLNAQSGVLSLSGKSYPENTLEFYEPMINWLKEYFKNINNQSTTLNIEIIYFNSSSSKLFFDIFDIIEDNGSQRDIRVNWIYSNENESAREAGEDFREEFDELNFTVLKKQ